MNTEQLELLLIRPGATHFDEEGRIKGSLDLPLSNLGTSQASRLAVELSHAPPELLYVAPGEAAEQTANIIAAQCYCRIKVVDRLRNLDFGLWQGKLISEVKRTQPRVYRSMQEAPETVCPPGGESVAEARRRAESELGRICRKHRKGRIGVVLFQPFSEIFRAAVTGGPVENLWNSKLDFATLEQLSLVSDKSGTSQLAHV